MINQEATEVVVVVDQEQKSKGSRGTVGEPTAGLTIKQMWKSAHFKLVDANKSKSSKRVWVKNKNSPSLKLMMQQRKQLNISGKKEDNSQDHQANILGKCNYW